MSVEGCIGVADFRRVDDNFDNVQLSDSTEVNYSPANQSTHKHTDPAVATHNVQKDKNQAFTIVNMLPEDTKVRKWVWQ